MDKFIKSPGFKLEIIGEHNSPKMKWMTGESLLGYAMLMLDEFFETQRKPSLPGGIFGILFKKPSQNRRSCGSDLRQFWITLFD